MSKPQFKSQNKEKGYSHINDTYQLNDWILTVKGGYWSSPSEKEEKRLIEQVYTAVKNGSLKTLKPLVKSQFLSPTNKALPQTLPLLAIHKKGEKVLSLLHEVGFDLNLANSFGQHVWSLAIERHLNNIIDVLIQLQINQEFSEENTRYNVYYSKLKKNSALECAFETQDVSLCLKLWPDVASFETTQKLFQELLDRTKVKNARFRVDLIQALDQQGLRPLDSKVYLPLLDELEYIHDFKKSEIWNLIEILAQQGLPFPNTLFRLAYDENKEKALLELKEMAYSSHLKHQLEHQIPLASTSPSKPFRL